ncbi:MAG: chorismate-binding protein [Oligoflexales bacterium]
MPTTPPYWLQLSNIPASKPTLWFRMDHQSIQTHDFTEIPSHDFLNKVWSPQEARLTPYQGGYLGLIPYNAFDSSTQHSIRIFRLNSMTHHTHIPTWKPQTPRWTLKAQDSDDNYLNTVEHVLNDIKNGRYYQINIIRFFKILHDIKQKEIIQKFSRQGGPWSAWCRVPNLEVASFSPERFLHIAPQSSQDYKMTTWPIKGTRPRHHDPLKDYQQKISLLHSRKEQAELHMIVDLMRNDMNIVSTPRSVKVLCPGKISSFSDIHHNIAKISSSLRPFSFNKLFQSMCPGGSITGTPKNEVMKAIKEYETASRKYFMGHIFYWDDAHILESNILIRTLVQEQNSWAYAAGGGLTLRSLPQEELDEIKLKCESVMQSKN